MRAEDVRIGMKVNIPAVVTCIRYAKSYPEPVIVCELSRGASDWKNPMLVRFPEDFEPAEEQKGGTP